MESNRFPLDRLPRNTPALGVSRAEERFSDDELAEMRERIGKRLCEAFGTDNYSHIARELKTTARIVQYYVEGVRFPAPEILLQFDKLKTKTGRSVGWLLTGENEKKEKKYSLEVTGKIRELAAAANRTFDEQEQLLVEAALGFLEKVND